jgi:hypothetical protein
MTAAPEGAAVETRGAPPDVICLPDQSQRLTKKSRSGSANRQRQAGVFVRMLPEELVRLTADAAAAEMTVQLYLLTGRLREDAAVPRRRRRVRAPLDETALMRALAAFNRANNNLNQIAHAGNRMALLSEQHADYRAVDDLRGLSSAVERLLGEFAAPIAAILEALGRVRER